MRQPVLAPALTRYTDLSIIDSRPLPGSRDVNTVNLYQIEYCSKRSLRSVVVQETLCTANSLIAGVSRVKWRGVLIQTLLNQKNRGRGLRVSLIACVLSVLCLHPVWADDTEIYFNNTHDQTVKPNILFILDASNSMQRYDCADNTSDRDNPCPGPNGSTTRLERMDAAMEQVLATLSDDINVGLMRFGGFDGGRIIYPVTNLGEPGARAEINDAIDDIELVLGTPTVGALEEAWRYFEGLAVSHGAQRAITHRSQDQRRSRVSHPDSYTGGVVAGVTAACNDTNQSSSSCQNEHIAGSPVYKSPVESECQANYAILLTDGGPYVGDNNTPPAYFDSIATIEGIHGGSCDNNITESDGVCGYEMAAFMRARGIITHAIGFNIRSDWIKDLVVDHGGGIYAEAASSDDLVSAILALVSGIPLSGTTIVAPSVQIDQFTRLSHREEVYLALFKPQLSANWVGNLKKYKFSGADPTLRDKNGNEVIDPVSGEFIASSTSFWSIDPDGDDILDGGAANRLNMNNRNMYSYLEIGTTDLTAVGNWIYKDNVTAAMLGSANNDADTLIRWLAGFDVKDEDEDQDNDDPRNHIGDPLHSNPVVVTYGVEAGQVLDEDNPNSLVFFGTNEGFLHAIDTQTGDEEYAFMPPELMTNVAELFANETLEKDEVRPYGLDGDLTLRTIDTNKNSLIEAAENDKAYLYAGMRRGGRNYYALDVSKKDTPEFLWNIIGGTGDFAELGQSWSRLIPTKIKIGNEVKDVLVFGGGYDPLQDDKDKRAPDSMGRAIYFVDANTGELIWSGGHPEVQPATSTRHFSFPAMEYSIPADLAIVPDPSTGLLSQIYVGDMGGRLWRFDIENGNSIADLVDGGIIADFGENGKKSGARRFYGTPDLSLSRIDGELLINIAIGSGYRAHPLNLDIKDQFFVFRYPFGGNGDDYGVEKNGSYTPASLSDLFDTTNNVIAEGTPGEIAEAQMKLAEAHGWRIELEDAGEKVLDHSSTFDGVVRFVSYVPSISADPCEPSLGNSFAYAVNLLDGSPFVAMQDNQVSNLHEKEFRRQLLPTPGIASPISTIFVEHNGTVTPTDVSGVNKLREFDNVNLLRKWFWSENAE